MSDNVTMSVLFVELTDRGGGQSVSSAQFSVERTCHPEKTLLQGEEEEGGGEAVCWGSKGRSSLVPGCLGTRLG